MFFKKKENVDFQKIYFYTTLLFAFTLPLSRAAISLFIVLLPTIWIIEGNFKKKFEILISNKVILYFTLFIFFSALSLLWTEEYQNAIRPLRMLTYFFPIYVLATSLNKKYIQQIISAFLFGMFISEIISYGIYFDIWHFKNVTAQDPTPFMLHLDYSVFLAFSSILLLNRLLSKHFSIKEKLFYLFFFFTVTGNLFITAGRTGQVALIIGILVVTILHFKISLKSLLTSFLLLFVIYFGAYNMSPNFKNRVLKTKTSITNVIFNQNYSTSIGVRVSYYYTTYNILKENLLIGVGIGDYLLATKKELEKSKYSHGYRKKFLQENTPHNQFLLILTQTGLIGFTLLILFMYHFFRLPSEDKEMKELSILFGTIFFVSCMADTFFMQQFTVALFGLFIGLFISSSQSETINDS